MLIPRRIFAMRQLASQDTARFQLNGVHFTREDGKPVAVATDGKVLGHVSWSEDNWEEMPEIGTVKPAAPVDSTRTTLRSDDCERAEKIVPKKHGKPILGNCYLDEPSLNGTATLTATDLDRSDTVTAEPIDGTFPDYTVALPKGKAKATVILNGAYLAQSVKTLLALMAPVEKGKPPMIRLEIHGPDRPIALIAEQAGQVATVLVMPIVQNK